MPSTQWSTARMPVERNSHCGVCRVIAGSRMTALGMTSGWRTLSFTLVAMLVTPALAENSPPAIVVGTLIWRTLGAVIGGGAPFAARMASILSTVRILLARQSCTAFAPSVIEPPPTVTMRSASAARGVLGHGIEDARATVAQSAFDFRDLVGFTPQRARHHQESAGGAQAVHLSGDRVGRRLAEYDLVHRAENDTAPMHVCPPGDDLVVSFDRD